MTEGQATLVACPAFLGHDGAARCGLPAEVEARYIVRSTDGPLESARIRCPRGHWFNGPIESLSAPGSRRNRSVRSASGGERSGPDPTMRTPRPSRTLSRAGRVVVP
jgi:hypothetical protein